MGATTAVHPTDQTLQSYGLGKLDDASAESVIRHLESCTDCQRRVAEMSSDSFLGRLQNAQGQPDKSADGWSQFGGSLTDRSQAVVVQPPADTLPPGLAEHPDYEVIRELGRGGMGVVYLAHNRLTGRDEVLKVVSGHLVERPRVRDRFLREIQLAAKLNHKNIVTVHTATRFGESIVLSMEYVEGYDLAKLVKSGGRLPVAHACYFVHQAALGLQHAHERGMVHRDIKPANLILARDGKKPVIKVLDFGLAKVTSEGQADSALTGEGQMLGTPDFIAPEQILDAQKADIRADIYSLGCTLYYLLAGTPPFRGDGLWDLYQAHFSMDAEPLNLVRPEVPVELAALVAKMLAKEPDRRFQTPGEVAQALTPFFKPASATRPVPIEEPPPINPRVTPNRTTSVGPAATQPADEGEAPAPAKQGPAKPVAEGVAWGSLIELKETEPVREPTPVVTAPRRQRAPWMWPAVAVGVLLLGLVIALAAVVLRFRTKDGDLVFSDLPEQAVVTVDGEVYTLEWPGGKGPAKVSVPEGEHKVRVVLNEVEVLGEQVKIAAGDKKWIRVRLVPLVASRPKDADAKTSEIVEEAAPQPAVAAVASQPVKVDYYARGLAGEWQPLRDNRGHVITGGAPALSSDDLELVFWKLHPEDDGGFEIYVARRVSADKPFGQAIHQRLASTKLDDVRPAFGRGDCELFIMVAPIDIPAWDSPRQIMRAMRGHRGEDFGVSKPLAKFPAVCMGGTQFSDDGRLTFYIPAGGRTWYRAEWKPERQSYECAETNLPGPLENQSFGPRLVAVSNNGSVVYVLEDNNGFSLLVSSTSRGPMGYEVPRKLFDLRLPHVDGKAYVASLNHNADVLFSAQQRDGVTRSNLDLIAVRLPESVHREVLNALGAQNKDRDEPGPEDIAAGAGTAQPSPPQTTKLPTERERTDVPFSLGEIRPINGRNFDGWNGMRLFPYQAVDPSDVFRIEGEELVWTGNRGRIFLDKSFGDFSFNFGYLLPLNGRHRWACCHLSLAEGEPYRIGQANYRVSEVGFPLTNSENSMTGDIVPFNPESQVEGGYIVHRKADAVRPADEWNEVEIRCEGRVIQLFLNGREVNRVEGNRAILCHPGFHADGTDIRIRNVRLVPLDKAGSGTARQKPEQSNVQKKTGPRKATKSKAVDALQPRSTWEGTWTFDDPREPGKEDPYKLIVKGRSGDHFTGESWNRLGNSAQWIRADLEGTIRGDRIEYEETAEDPYRFSIVGIIGTNQITFKFQGRGTAGNARFGHGRIALQRK